MTSNSILFTEADLFIRIDKWIRMLTEATKPWDRVDIAESLRLDIKMLRIVQEGDGWAALQQLHVDLTELGESFL